MLRRVDMVRRRKGQIAMPLPGSCATREGSKASRPTISWRCGYMKHPRSSNPKLLTIDTLAPTHPRTSDSVQS
jgi:hypothetical protein